MNHSFRISNTQVCHKAIVTYNIQWYKTVTHTYLHQFPVIFGIQDGGGVGCIFEERFLVKFKFVNISIYSMVMADVTKESFLSLSNEEMWDLFKKTQLEASSIRQLNAKIDVLIGKIDKLDSEIAIGKTVNNALKSEIINIKRKQNRVNQYHRRENLEFSGIPESTSDQNLEKIALALLKKTGVDISSNDIVDCHRLRNKKTVIVRFVNRKHAVKALLNSKKLNGKTNDIVNNSVIYLNRNLTPEYKSLRWKSKKLKLENYINDFGVNQHGVWVKAEADGPRKQVDVDEDLYEYLPQGISLADICK